MKTVYKTFINYYHSHNYLPKINKNTAYDLINRNIMLIKSKNNAWFILKWNKRNLHEHFY